MLDLLRHGTVAAAFVAALALSAPSAAAAPKKEKENLAPPPAGSMQDAKGKVEAKERGTERTMKVDVKRLQPNRQYEVRRRGESAPLGTIDTNRKGKGRTRITEPSSKSPAQALNAFFPGGTGDPGRGGDDGMGGDGGDGGGLGDGDCDYGDPSGGGCDDGGWGGYGGYGGGGGHGGGYGYYYYYYYYPGYPCEEPREEEPCAWYCVEIVDAETGETILECEGEEHRDPLCDIPVLEDYEFGWSDCCGENGEFASVLMESYTFEEEEYESFYLSMMVPVQKDDCWWVEWRYFELFADQDTGLPLGVDSVDELEGRAYEIRDGEGNVVMACELPVMESYGDVPIFYPAGGDGSGGDGGGGDDGIDREDSDYTLWIDDGTGTLVEAGRLVELVYDDIYIPYEPGPANGLPGASR